MQPLRSKLKASGDHSPHISVVTPVYGFGLDLAALHERLESSISQITDSFEVLMVNDASPGGDWKTIVELSSKDSRVKGINLSRNFGQHRAITAGLDLARGDWCVVMDCDLQDRPEEIPRLYQKAQEGFDSVVARRGNRQDPLLTKLGSKIFYHLFNYLTEQKLDNRIANYGIYSRRVIQAVLTFKELDRSFGLLAAQVGFPRTSIIVSHDARISNQSGYSFKKKVNLALDHILSHSNKPLRLAVKGGFFLSLAAFLYASWLIIRYVSDGGTVSGWTSLIVSMFFLSGVIISLIGVVGLYIGKIYNEVRNRPLYIIADTTFQLTDEKG